MVTHRRPEFRPSLQILEDRCVPATFTVKNVNDAGPGSLRAAIAAANTLPNLDTIVFKPGLEGTILLTTGKIDIKGNLVIAGPGAGKITINGNASDRIFNIDDQNLATFKNVAISGLTLFNGFSGGEGGAIRCVENLSLRKTVITGNKADIGGGIHSYTGKLTIRGSTIQGNEATIGIGGGLFLDDGVGLIAASQIRDNRAATDGGGILQTNTAKLTLRSTTLSGNTSGGSGGGLFATNSAGSLIIENSTLTGNRAEVTGGGLYSHTALTLTKTKITFNTAKKNGGGITTLADAAIARCLISGNACLGDPADGLGGGISHNYGILSVTDSTISGNSAKLEGGGIFVALSPTASTIRRCTITGNTTVSGDGGGISSIQNDLVIDRCVITGNTALDGGGISQKNNHLELIASTISGNRSRFNGGGVYLGDTAAASTIKGSTIAANSAAGAGGGVFGIDNAALEIQNSTLSGNRATLQGGALFLVNSSPATIQNSTIAFNEAGILGGGIFLGLGDMNLASSIVAQNRAPASPDLASGNVGDDFNVTVSLIGSATGANVPSPDQTTQDLLGKDPLLAPLASNGGPTLTHKLMKGSPAINAGPASVPGVPFDQRGKPFKRKLGLAVDIGAFERQ